MPVYKLPKLKLILLLLAFVASITWAQLPKAILEINQQRIPVELAKTSAEQAQGLSGRESLPKNTGMYFVFPDMAAHSFWMKDMNFPLDIIWIRQGEIVGILANVPKPVSKTAVLPLYPSVGVVDAVLEINAGESQQKALKIGDRVKLLDP